MDIKLFREKVQHDGWVLFESVIDDDFLELLRVDLEQSYKMCREIQIKNGLADTTDGTVHHIICLKNTFLTFLEKGYLHDYLTEYFDGPYILNSFGGVKNLKDNLSYVGNIHRDIRTFSGELNLMINMLVMLDDFTVENGATFLMPGSHRCPQKPEESDFYSNAVRAVGKKGSIVLFNSNLWHAAGINKTDLERRALTLSFTKPFIKQQLDYPRFFGNEPGNQLSESMKQILGYNARIPSNLDEWYQPPEKRFYKRNQG